MAGDPHTRVKGRRHLTASFLLAALLCAGCGSSGDDDGEPSAGAGGGSGADQGSSASPAPELPEVTDITEAGGAVFDVADADWTQVVDGSAWTTVGDPAAIRLDPTSGRETARITTKGPTCTGMDVGYGALWTGVCSDPAAVLRIEPKRGRALATIELEGRILQEEGSLAAGFGAVWAVTTGAKQELVRIDARTNRVAAAYPLPPGAAGVGAGLGGLWVTDAESGTVLRIDPETGRTIKEVETGPEPRFLDVGEGALWVQNSGDGTVARIDPTTDEVVAKIVVDERGISGGEIRVGVGSVWSRPSSSLVSQIDPATNKVVARYGPSSGSGGVAADADAVWVTDHDVNKVYRLPLD